jgi:curved DNA-binding protein CbpA
VCVCVCVCVCERERERDTQSECVELVAMPFRCLGEQTRHITATGSRSCRVCLTAFADLQAAYEILSNPQRREVFNKFGRAFDEDGTPLNRDGHAEDSTPGYDEHGQPEGSTSVPADAEPEEVVEDDIWEQCSMIFDTKHAKKQKKDKEKATKAAAGESTIKVKKPKVKKDKKNKKQKKNTNAEF